MKVKLILRREIEREVKGKEETIRNHFIKEILPTELKDEIYDLLDREDDPESQYHSYGIATGLDSEIIFIDIGRFVEQLESEIERVCDEDFDYSGYKKLVNFLKPYKDFKADWREIEEDASCQSSETEKKNGS